jgi:hypothetical protein
LALVGLEGDWAGQYQAQKASIVLPPNVRDRGFEADDGRIAAGPGSVELTISRGGLVRGKVLGSLGVGVLSGRAEDGALRTKLDPEDPRAPNAMSGTLVGVIRGDAILGKIAAAGPDATVVREASIELARKKN